MAVGGKGEGHIVALCLFCLIWRSIDMFLLLPRRKEHPMRLHLCLLFFRQPPQNDGFPLVSL